MIYTILVNHVLVRYVLVLVGRLKEDKSTKPFLKVLRDLQG